jgi:hypothetical protein
MKRGVPMETQHWMRRDLASQSILAMGSSGRLVAQSIQCARQQGQEGGLLGWRDRTALWWRPTRVGNRRGSAAGGQCSAPRSPHQVLCAQLDARACPSHQALTCSLLAAAFAPALAQHLSGYYSILSALSSRLSPAPPAVQPPWRSLPCSACLVAQGRATCQSCVTLVALLLLYKRHSHLDSFFAWHAQLRCRPISNCLSATPCPSASRLLLCLHLQHVVSEPPTVSTQRMSEPR